MTTEQLSELLDSNLADFKYACIKDRPEDESKLANVPVTHAELDQLVESLYKALQGMRKNIINYLDQK